MDTPIFSQLLWEYRESGRWLPWVVTVKPDGAVRRLHAVTQGAHPLYRVYHKRSAITGQFIVRD